MCGWNVYSSTEDFEPFEQGSDDNNKQRTHWHDCSRFGRWAHSIPAFNRDNQSHLYLLPFPLMLEIYFEDWKKNNCKTSVDRCAWEILLRALPPHACLNVDESNSILQSSKIQHFQMKILAKTELSNVLRLLNLKQPVSIASSFDDEIEKCMNFRHGWRKSILFSHTHTQEVPASKLIYFVYKKKKRRNDLIGNGQFVSKSWFITFHLFFSQHLCNWNIRAQWRFRWIYLILNSNLLRIIWSLYRCWLKSKHIALFARSISAQHETQYWPHVELISFLVLSANTISPKLIPKIPW